MSQRPAVTLILVTRDEIIRADLTRSPWTMTGFWAEQRPDLPDLPSVVEVALLMGPRPGKQVWVLCTDLWTQRLELAARKSAGMSEAELAGALNFEAESLSGLAAFEAMLALTPLEDRDGQQGYWIVQARTLDVEQIDAIVRRASARLMGVGHPGGLPRSLSREYDPSQSWQRIELWPDTVLALHGEPGRPASIQVFNTDPQMGRWKAEVETWQQMHGTPSQRELLVAAGVALPEDVYGQKLFRLDNEAARAVWLIDLTERLQLKQPGLPLIRPLPVPLTTGQRRGIAAGIAVAVLGLCLAHYYLWLTPGIQLASAGRERFLEPQKRLTEFQKQTKDLETRHDKLKQQTEELQRGADRLTAQRERLARLLTGLAEYKADDLLVQKIDNQGSEPRIHGVCLQPELADQLARALSDHLRPYGWEVQTPAKKALNLVPGGGPWQFEIAFKIPADTPPALKNAPRGKRGS